MAFNFKKPSPQNIPVAKKENKFLSKLKDFGSMANGAASIAGKAATMSSVPLKKKLTGGLIIFLIIFGAISLITGAITLLTSHPLIILSAGIVSGIGIFIAHSLSKKPKV